jgi:DNA polymerase-1
MIQFPHLLLYFFLGYSMPQVNTKKLFLIDGSGFIFRAYHALPPLTRADGTPIGAVLGFTNMLMRLLVEMKAHHMAVIFDAGKSNFRHTLYPAYKSNRAQTPEDLVPQFPIIKEVCRAFNVPVIEQEGYEADDLIATYAQDASSKGFDVVIVSSDKDLMQLVSDKVIMFDQMKNKYIGIPEVHEKFGVGPEKVVEVQALAGDSSDNIPGIPGIGPKTAAQLIQEYGNLEELLKQTAQIKQQKRRESLIEHADLARISHKLVTLCKNLPLPILLEDLLVSDPEPEKLSTFLNAQGFKSLAHRFGIKPAASVPIETPLDPSPSKNHYESITSLDRLNAWIEESKHQGAVSILLPSSHSRVEKGELLGIGLGIGSFRACYIPLTNPLMLNLGNAQGQTALSLEKVIERIKPLFEDASVLKIGHHIKKDFLLLKKYGISLEPVEDIMLMGYLLSDGSYDLHSLALKYLDEDLPSDKEKIQGSFHDLSFEEALTMIGPKVLAIQRLQKTLRPALLKASILSVYETIERPLIPILADMEDIGIRVSPTVLKNLSQEFSQEMTTLERNIFALSGHPFNIGSPKQLGEVLFKEMGLPEGKKTKGGSSGTGADILERLAAQGYELPAQILKWRQFAKLKSTYTDAFLEEIDPKTGRVHTSYLMAGTSTGRLASAHPNLQNIPIRTEEGRKIRSAFIASPGYKLVSLDYSQIELRLLAHFAQIDSLRDAFHHGIDIHSLTASQVFGKDLDHVTPELRRQAKAINFGIIYGMSPFGLSQQLGIPTSQAAAYIKAYEAQYPGIKAYMEQTKEFAKTHGYVQTLSGRKCFVPLIFSKNPAIKAGAERQAINAPLQGSAADIIKKAMIKIPGELKNHHLDSKMLLQVHDELIFEAPLNQLQETISVAKTIMETVIHLTVPLVVDAGFGNNWTEAH